MTRCIMTLVLSFAASLLPTIAAAEEAVNAYSRGNAVLYYTFIAVVLIYGLHDTFRQRRITLTAAVVIPVLFYFLLPAQ
jgi:hypothetical protein